MKRVLSVLISAAVCLTVISAGFCRMNVKAEETEPLYTNDLLKVVDAQEKDDAYYQELLEACIYNNKVIRNFPFTFEDESWHDYRKALNKAVKIETIDEDGKVLLDTAAQALEDLVQVEPVEAHTLYIWDDDMPCIEDPETIEWTSEAWDVPEFRPFLIPYILEDQTDVKGNIIIVSGGGYDHRANDAEGYVLAPLFNDMGYNAFVLQRRVAPYEREDIWMDLQRSIRYIRHNAEELGIGTDYMIINGYSGGSRTVMSVVQYLYGDIQPTVYDADYVPDEVDAENSDVDAAFAIYGTGADSLEITGEDGKMFHLDNPNLPALFIAVGANDSETILGSSIILAQEANDLTMVDLHVFGNTGHGFGKGLPKSNSIYWMEMADNFVAIDKATNKK